MDWLYDKVKSNPHVKTEEQLVYSISLCALAVAVGFLHFLFFIVFTILNVPEMQFMNFTSILCYFYVVNVIVKKDNIIYSIYISLLLILYYVIFSAYFVGYEKNIIIILPVIVISLYNIYELSRKHLMTMTLIVFLAYIVLIYFRYNVDSKYEGELMFLDLVNVTYAFSAGIFSLYTNKLSYLYMKRIDVQKIELLSKEVNTDYLTGLWNRRYIFNKFKEKNIIGNYCVVIADIDYFKKINDTYGHDAGDYILKQVAKIFVDKFDDKDIICRWGGEEFVIILKEEDESIILEKLEMIRSFIEHKIFKFKGIDIRLTMSFGVQHIVKHIEFDDAIKYADEALYFSKGNGRNQVMLYDNIPL